MIPKNTYLVRKYFIYKGCKDFRVNENYPNLPKGNLLEFYVLVHSSVNYGPNLDFKVSTGSLDRGDFKNDLKTYIFVPQMP